jgi:hypothetical protein
MTSHWRGCLLVTGRDLNPDKCSWIIGFYWDADGQWHYCLDISVSIRTPNSSGELQALKRLAPLVSTTVVGVVQAADGNMLDQVKALKATADDMGNHIHKGYSSKTFYLANSPIHGVAFFPIPSSYHDNFRSGVRGDYQETICPTYPFWVCLP